MSECQESRSTSYLRAIAIIAVMVCLCGCRSEPTQKSDTSSEPIVRKATKGEVELTVEASPKNPRLSDLVDLTITITHPLSIQVEPPAFGQSVGDFAVRDYKERKQPTPNSDKTTPIQTQVIRYKLEPMFSGRHLIRSIPIVLTTSPPGATATREVLESEPIEMNVTSEFGDIAPDLSQVDPMLDPIESQSSRILWGVIAIVVVALVVALVAWMIRRTKKPSQPIRIITPEEAARSALDQLIAEQLPSKGLVKEFYLRLTGIVRVFIEGKTGLRAPEQTTEEFLREMRRTNYFEPAQSNRLQEFLVAADLVKYAGQTPDEAHIQQSVDRAGEFISIRFDTSETQSSEASQ